MKKTLPLLALAAALVLPALARVDVAKSSVSAVSRQMGVPVEGKFSRFSAEVAFDPARPADGKASVEIDIASFDLGADEFNRETVKPEWFNAAKFPKASFVTSAIRPLGPGRLEAAGKLTIKGISREVVAPVSYRTEGGRQVFEGALPIRRLQFNIGEGEWKDTSTVADEVEIRFRIVTTGK
ncbi:MAG TPA: YceI family protein [Candidatus Desulfobacillus sp.]|nr:YceI family protein [Candidatus Desulfobacillus sp.]